MTKIKIVSSKKILEFNSFFKVVFLTLINQRFVDKNKLKKALAT